FLRERLKLARGERLLVIGASGAVGSAAVQIGRALGAHVTGVASAGNHDLLHRIGAEAVRDYRDWSPGDDGAVFDVILDTTGQVGIDAAAQGLRPGGRLGLVVGDVPLMLRLPFIRLGQGRKVLAGTAPERRDDLLALAAMAEQGLFRPVVGSVTPLDRIVEAHRITDSGHKVGSAVVRVAADPA
ncbi:MAG: hypothetical protein RLZZ528_274, partial [Pseudomonadota bacterium]